MVKFHRRPFFILCFLEFFERFGYYGFSYISIYFYMAKLGFSESSATTLMGGFAALTYVFNAVGGYTADNILGIKRTMFTGVGFLVAGYALLGLGTENPLLIYLALTAIIIGSCLFKPAPTNLIASIYSHDAKLLDSTYTLFYMSINMGSFCASLLIPYLSKNYGYTPTLLLCSFGLLVGALYNLKFYSAIKKVDNPVGHAPLQLKKVIPLVFTLVCGFVFIAGMLQHDSYVNWFLLIASVIIFGYFIFQVLQEKDRKQRQKMIVAIILLFYAVVFFVIYQQKNTSFMLFNRHHVNLNFLGWEINPQTVPGFLGTIGIICLSPIFARIYRKLGDKDLSLPHKFAVGLSLASCAYGIMYLLCLVTNPLGKINFAWEIIAISVFFSSAELLISALGVSLMAQLVPAKMRGFAIGTWFITSALGIKLGSYIASLAANQTVGVNVVYSTNEQINSFLRYEVLFRNIFICGMIASILAFIMAKRLKQMIS